MDFQAKDIAKLVLGYLREEKCTSAFTEFLNTSPHLHDYSVRFQKGKPIVTRMFGLSLMDYLSDYATIYTYILERIELSDYHNIKQLKHATIVSKLQYLLGNENYESRPNTPNDLSTQTVDSSINNDHTETAEKSTNTDNENSVIYADKCNISQEIFNHTFLENKKLHKKLADTINKTVSEFNSSPETNAGQDIDFTIKKIINHTEQDPIFNQLIDDILVGIPDEPSNSNSSIPDPSVQSNEVLSTPTIRQRTQNSRTKSLTLQNGGTVDSVVTFSEKESKAPTIELQMEKICGNNQVFTRANSGLLMIQPPSTNILPSIQVDVSKPYCVIGTQSDVPQLNTVFTEQDILTMPTIIVCDNQPNTTQIVNIVHTAGTGTSTTSHLSSHSNLVPIAPKNEVPAQTLSDYISRYSCDGPSPIRELKANRNQHKQEARKAAAQKRLDKIEKISCTPKVDKIDISEPRSRSTPHSGGSHIRQLNFETPEKVGGFMGFLGMTSLKNKTVESVGVVKEKRGLLDSVPVVNPLQFLNDENVPVKEVHQNSLEETNKASEPATNKVKVGETATTTTSTLASTSWDADLRSSLANCTDSSSKPQKRKRILKDSPGKIPSTRKKKIKRVDKPNTTAQNAAKIEAMLISPDKEITAKNRSVPTIAEIIEKNIEVVNVNTKAKYKKKCNIGSDDVQHFAGTEQVVLTSIAKVTSCEIMEDVKNKVAPTPSKINANKRSITNLENKETDTQNLSEKQQTVAAEKPKIYSGGMPLLETPVKHEAITIPKTPGILNTSEVNTPFTKAVIEQLREVDLTAIQTPKFPITPNFGLTPLADNEQLPLVGKPSDYSTSSSYYQPNDAEQSKSLEQLIEECKRLEEGSQQIKRSPAVCTILQEFNHSLVGRKNLHLVKRSTDSEIEISSSSSDSSGSDSEDAPTKKSDLSDKHKNTETTSRYEFRPRKTPLSKHKVEKSPQEASPKVKKTRQELVLLEMEEKRQRTIARIKRSPLKTQNKEVSKPKQPVRRKSLPSTTKKTPKKRSNSTMHGSAVVNNKEVLLHLPSDDEMETVEPFEIVETNLQESSNSSTPALPSEDTATKIMNESKQDAESLVKGLKEWGIHLIPKKKQEPLQQTPKEKIEPNRQIEVKSKCLDLVEETKTFEKPVNENANILEKSEPHIKVIEEYRVMPDNSVTHVVSETVDQAVPIVLSDMLHEPSLAPQPNNENESVMLSKQSPKSKTEDAKIESKPSSSTKSRKRNSPDLEEGEIVSDVESPKKPKWDSSTSRSRHRPTIKKSQHIKDCPIKSSPIRKRSKYCTKISKSPATRSSEGLAKRSSEGLIKRSSESLTKKSSEGHIKRSSESLAKKSSESLIKRSSESLTKKSSEGLIKRTSETSTKRSPIRKRSRSPKKRSSRKNSEVKTESKVMTIFDIHSIDEETVNIQHDYNNESTRTFADYNLDVFKKIISAVVSIEEYGIDVTKVMSHTPTHYILDIPSNDLIRTSTINNLYPNKSPGYKCDSTDIQYKIAERKYLEKCKERNSEKEKSPKTEETIKVLLEQEAHTINSVNLCERQLSNRTEAENSPSGINDDLMNYAVVGSVREPNCEESENLTESLKSPNATTSSNNKNSIIEDNKNLQSNLSPEEILKSFDVDRFLQKLHG